MNRTILRAVALSAEATDAVLARNLTAHPAAGARPLCPG
jgi:hypothetical protein